MLNYFKNIYNKIKISFKNLNIFKKTIYISFLKNDKFSRTAILTKNNIYNNNIIFKDINYPAYIYFSYTIEISEIDGNKTETYFIAGEFFNNNKDIIDFIHNENNSLIERYDLLNIKSIVLFYMYNKKPIKQLETLDNQDTTTLQNSTEHNTRQNK